MDATIRMRFEGDFVRDLFDTLQSIGMHYRAKLPDHAPDEGIHQYLVPERGRRYCPEMLLHMNSIDHRMPENGDGSSTVAVTFVDLVGRCYDELPADRAETLRMIHKTLERGMKKYIIN